MTTLLDHPSTDAGTDAEHRMRTAMTAARLSFTWFGVSKISMPQAHSGFVNVRRTVNQHEDVLPNRF